MTLFNEYMRGLEVLEFIAPATGQFVRSMGVPVESPRVDRAAVIYTGDANTIQFAMNEEYVKTLTDDELAAVLAHEAHHIILRHLQERFEKTFEVDSYLVEAHECIINDQIPVRFGLTLPEDTYSGPNDFGEDFADLTSAEGYEVVKNFYADNEKPDEQDPVSDEENEESATGGGSGNSSGDSQSKDESSEDDVSNEGDEKSAGGAASDEANAPEPDGDTKGCNGIIIDPNADPSVATQALDDLVARAFDGVSADDVEREMGAEARDAIQESMDDANNASGSNSFSMSDSPDGVYDKSHYGSDGAVTNWEELIKHIDPGNGSDVARWNRYNPAITAIYPSVVLPLFEREQYGNRSGKPVVVLALDFSGSTPAHLLGTLVAMADSIPSSRVEPKVITWSDSVCEYGPDKRTVYRGGTNFANMIRWVRDEETRTNQEHHIVCVSDGIFDSKRVDYEDSRFHYVNIPANSFFGGRERPHDFSNRYKLSDFVTK